MGDPELVARAQRAAVRLERSWDRWRRLHGLAAEQAQPVSSYVGYSLAEPWGQPRVIFGVAAEEAEQLSALLEHDECVDPRYSQGLLWEPEMRDRHDRDRHNRDRHDTGSMAADLAGWGSGELPGQASARLAEQDEGQAAVQAAVQSANAYAGPLLPGADVDTAEPAAWLRLA
jgi:hypothetical protein